ncbi:hypothetical protein TIFTF001_019980 [Ficus carica]|uniref:Uncharacterized protein n=1 Tax=Ficus carica TaxID=3494 RepID=A0AA88DJI4_FICCA|nr:hypothetical protein TIFTF001_019980 [Ficus carica]
MKTLISPNLTINRWKPHFSCSVFLFNFPSLSRENRKFFDFSRGKRPCRPGGLLRLSFVRANCVSEPASYGGWDNLVLFGDSDRSGEAEAEANQFRNFLVSVGVDDKKHIFSFILGLLCALAISRVRVSSIVVFPASLLVFALGFSFGLVRGGGIGELNYGGNKRRAKDEIFRVYVEKFRNLVEAVDDFDDKVSNLRRKIQKAIDSREITVGDLEEYTNVLESVTLSASNARNVIEVSSDNLGSVILAENQKSSKRKKELGEIGYDFFQSIGGLFKENLVDPKPTKVKNNVKRETVENDRTRDSNLVPSIKETVLNHGNKPRANYVVSQVSSNELPFDEDGYGRIRNGKSRSEEISRYRNRINYSEEYGYESKRLQLMNNHRISLKMDRNNQIDTWESNDNLLESVNFSVRMKHTETEASFLQEQKLEKSDDNYRSSHVEEESEYSVNGSPLREDSANGKDNFHVAGQLSGHESEVPSPSSSSISDDVVFDRYLTEANDLLQQAKQFMRDGREKDRAEIVLYKSAKLLSNAIAMKPASLLAVGQLGNTYLLHGELKLRISRELRTLLYSSSPSSVGKWDRLHDQMGKRSEITSGLINACEECEELLVEAGRKYRMALSIDGNDVRALYNWGLALNFRAQLIADIGPEAAFDADRVFMAAIDKFNAMMSKGNVHAPDALFRWGMVLQQRSRLRPSKSKEKVKLLQQAKRLYEDALGMDVNNVQVREALSTCISELSSRY